jgi:hypothetical protein
LLVSDDRLRHTVTVTPRSWKWIAKRVVEYAFILFVLVHNLQILWEEVRAPGVSVSAGFMVLLVLFALVVSYFWARLWIWVAKWAWRGIRRLFQRVPMPRRRRPSRRTLTSAQEVSEASD